VYDSNFRWSLTYDFFDFMIVGRNTHLDFHFLSFPGPLQYMLLYSLWHMVLYGMWCTIFSHDAGQGQEAAAFRE
jgi:hypothetical protein